VDPVKRPTLKAFLAMPCGEVLDDLSVSLTMESLIAEWAVSMLPDQGQLPSVPGRDFASWLDHVWEDWTGEPEVPVQKILEGAVSEWCGGRSF
jgi:hypothetical protein